MDKYLITRRSLEVIRKHYFPVHCLTKSPLILRDLDILEEIDGNAKLPEDLRENIGRGVLITFSFSTLREEIARIFEPNAPLLDQRIEAIKKILDKGFMAGIAYMPILPYITDNEIDDMIKLAKDLGCKYVYFAPLTLQGKGRELFMRFLEIKYPEFLKEYKILYHNRYSPPKWWTKKFYVKITGKLKRRNIRFGPTNIEPKTMIKN